MAQDAQLISQAGQVESLASDGLVSVSTGAGQPQKNMELAKFADSLGSSVPLQQTSEQVSITGLYARTSDGKMVELTKESVASVVSGLIGFDNVAIPQGRLEQKDFFNNSLNFRQNGMYLFNASNITDESSPVTSSSLWVIENKRLYGDSDYLVQSLYSVGQSVCYIRFVTDTSFGSWSRIDNFGYNTLAELSSGVAEQLKLTGFVSGLLRGSKKTPEGIAEDVLSYLKDDCRFFLTHNYSGHRLVYGYLYGSKKYGSIMIKQYDGSASVVDIENGEMKIRS